MKVYNLDEFRTSKLNHKTEEVCENLYLPNVNGVIRKLHSVLTYKMENGQMGCINRDENAVNNMIKIINHYLDKRKRLNKKRNKTKGDNLHQKGHYKSGGQVSTKPMIGAITLDLLTNVSRFSVKKV